MTTSDSAGKEGGPPSWNGDAASFQEYEESCLLWEQSVAWEKRYLCGPRLAAQLSGAAKRYVAGRHPSWLAHVRGVEDLLAHLRTSLGKPQVSDLTEHLSRYFKGSRRRSGESVNEYISRKTEIYLRACQAFQRVRPHQKGSGAATTSGTPAWTPAWNASRRSSVESSTTTAAGETEAEATTTEDNPTENQDDWSRWRDDQWTSGSYGWGSSSWWSSGWNWSYKPWAERPSPEAPSIPELLPDYVQGWYLLHDSGLSGAERNVVQTALQGDFSLSRVAQELRNQCAVLDNQRKEYSGRNSGFIGDYQDSEAGIEEHIDDGFLGDLPDEELEQWESAEHEAQEAMAAMHTAKREARQKQSNVRLARQYFRTNAGNQGAKGKEPHKPRDDSKIHCLRCGVLGHRVANCPIPVQTAKAAEEVEATSSFICYSEEQMSMTATTIEQSFAAGISTSEAVAQGKAVIDGGATRTLASCAAMEAIMALNAKRSGHNGLLKVDKENCPTFGFGNGSTNRCTATVQLAIRADEKPGSLTVHCLDQGTGPLLLSVDTLRRLKAVIDFESDLVCFRALDAKRLVPVERSQTGHQLLPMTEDLFENSLIAKSAVTSFRDLVQDQA